MINKKEDIIRYFESGIKDIKDFKIGIEHEKFLFDQNTNKRVDYPIILKMFKGLYEFGWKPILENKNIIGLKKMVKVLHWNQGIKLNFQEIN